MVETAFGPKRYESPKTVENYWCIKRPKDYTLVGYLVVKQDLHPKVMFCKAKLFAY